MTLKHLSLFLCCLLPLASCSKNSPTGPTGSSFVKAGAGSTFTFDEYSTDSLNAIEPGSRDTLVSTVINTNGSIANKTGVIVVENVRASEHDTSYYAYENDNDVSMLTMSESTGEPIWMVLPVGTGTTVVTASADTMEDLGIVTIVRDSTIASLISSENITVKGQSVSTEKVQLSFREVITVDGVAGIEGKVDNLLYYAPSLGFMAKTTSPSRSDPGGGWIDGSFQSLIGYDLK
ncbi:MAG TPA: hypothetical protein VGM92_06690 [Candidatus Kapabacteria bacterium]|jgi:hypothetical protein